MRLSKRLKRIHTMHVFMAWSTFPLAINKHLCQHLSAPISTSKIQGLLCSGFANLDKNMRSTIAMATRQLIYDKASMSSANQID